MYGRTLKVKLNRLRKEHPGLPVLSSGGPYLGIVGALESGEWRYIRIQNPLYQRHLESMGFKEGVPAVIHPHFTQP